jgi:hydroxypyruvate isomerase
MIYEDEPFVDRIDRVADLGFDTVEFWTWPEKDIDVIEARLDDYGLSLAGMAANTELRRPEELRRPLTDPTKQAAVIADIKETIEMANRLDCPNLIVLVGPQLADYTDEEMYESIVECLREIAPIAEAAGVNLVLEPLNTTVDHKNYFLEQSDAAAEIVRDVDSQAVQILFDVYHQQISEGNIISNVRNYLDVIGYLHIADVPGRHEPGTGELNYSNILAAIDDTGYNGYTGFEFRPKNSTRRALESIAELTA